MKLYDYWRSATAFRVRIALNHKNIPYEQFSVHLIKDGGEQHGDAYRAINPQGLVPALEHDGHIITQSMAIVEYIDEIYPDNPLMPSDALGRARVRAMANVIAADTHPIQNLRVMQKLKSMGIDQEGVNAWEAHWIETGLNALEKLLDKNGQYFYGDTVTIADIAIAPQMVNAKRFNADLSACPNVVERIERLMALPAFDAARPEAQPDAEV